MRSADQIVVVVNSQADENAVTYLRVKLVGRDKEVKRQRIWHVNEMRSYALITATVRCANTLPKP